MRSRAVNNCSNRTLCIALLPAQPAWPLCLLLHMEAKLLGEKNHIYSNVVFGYISPGACQAQIRSSSPWWKSWFLNVLLTNHHHHHEHNHGGGDVQISSGQLRSLLQLGERSIRLGKDIYRCEEIKSWMQYNVLHLIYFLDGFHWLVKQAECIYTRSVETLSFISEIFQKGFGN